MFKCVYDMCDVVSHLIHCVDDNTYLVTVEDNINDFWIPSIKCSTDAAWSINSQKELKEIFGIDLNSDRVLRLFRVWIPNHSTSFVYHVIYEFKCNGELKKKSKNSNNKYRGKLKWLSEPELWRFAHHDSLRSPEIMDLLQLTRNPNDFLKRTNSSSGEGYNPTIGCIPPELDQNGTLIEISEYQSLVLDPTVSIHAQLVEAAGFKRDFQCLLYREFILNCYPAIFMNLQTFCRFIVELGWNRDEAVHLFRAADVYNRYGLSFRDFLYVLAAVDPGTSHGGAPAELRCRYIFRFFDRDRDTYLCYAEFKNLVTAVRRSKKISLDPLSISRETDTSLKDMGFNSDAKLTINDFLHSVGELKFRGTSLLFRSTRAITSFVNDLQERERLAENKSIKHDTKMGKAMVSYTPTPNEKSSRVQNIADYEVAIHSIRLQKSGTNISYDDIFTLDAALSQTTIELPIITNQHRIFSTDLFNQKSLCNEVIKALRYIATMNPIKNGQAKSAKDRKSDVPFVWGQVDSLVYARNLIKVCNLVRDQMRNEKRLLQIYSPVYVLGDIHGNFSDLLYFEKALWHFGPQMCPVTLLFLGDYVDRGPYSMEVISYLFSYKIQCGSKMCLLRGNHEIRNVQKMFTFETECYKKFGDTMGKEVWNAVNNAFDTMPLAATIDGKIFCCHGGIPPPWLCPVVSAINSIPIPLNEPDIQSPLAWELMWNDPLKRNQTTESGMMELLANEGFASNARRGTGHIFSVEALDRFLMVNGFSHVLRAHELAQSGFNVQQNGKLVTVFSSSKYCGATNEAACIVADQGKLRVLRLQTN